MKLARKLTIALMLGILVVMSAYAYFQLRQEVVLSEADLQRARRLAFAWLGVIEDVWQHEGPARAHDLAERASERAPEVRMRILARDAAGNLPDVSLSAAEQDSLRSRGVVRRVQVDPAGSEWRQVYVPLTVQGDQPAVVEYTEPMAAERSFIDMSHLGIAGATLAVVLVCGLIATGLEYWLVGRPLQLVRNKAARAGAGDFAGPVVLGQRDEIGELAQDINAMCDRLAEANRQLVEQTEARIAALEQLRHTDRLATVGQLAAGVAHELGTPLSVVSARAELIAATDLPRRDVLQSASVIAAQCDRMTAIIQQLLDFSRRRGVKLALVDLRHVVAGALDLLSSVTRKRQVELTCEVGDVPLLVRIDKNQMQQALTNIVLNAVQAVPPGGRVRVRVEARWTQPPKGTGATEGDYASVAIEDQGPGIEPEHLASIFEPFFTTKGEAGGTGLGLPVAQGIVAEHGGWIGVDSAPGRGTRFSIFLPVAPPAAAATAKVA
jgi:signal transduction histidine kinase